ncbi:hypothetical protein AXG93_4401s1030 [Marchantia polymorpha subsp. ruderalis]|uniref:Uncharacterized protein n=1 Tax=Marchantia polymorpha subsp. ruderalis TaxID=1480154 RepID=A0A176W5M3_MARPO|nr:hypothetical protein AXG93_4401s1030 [Marchantia polymorpha subsp. ruderalis]
MDTQGCRTATAKKVDIWFGLVHALSHVGSHFTKQRAASAALVPFARCVGSTNVAEVSPLGANWEAVTTAASVDEADLAAVHVSKQNRTPERSGCGGATLTRDARECVSKPVTSSSVNKKCDVHGANLAGQPEDNGHHEVHLGKRSVLFHFRARLLQNIQQRTRFSFQDVRHVTGSPIKSIGIPPQD